MEGEFNNNNLEMHQPEGGPIGSSKSHWSVVGLIVVLVVIVAIVAWIGNWSLNREASNGQKSLTSEEKQQILDSLRRSPDTPSITPAQKQEIINSLQAQPQSSPLTESEKQQILDSLKK